jgi:NitT/TauT family transport system ATP-binding protein
MPALQLHDIAKTYGAATVLQGVSLAVRQGEVLAVVGPSGCGKSTLLQIAAGLIPPSEGHVEVEGRAVHAPPEGLVYLFQQYTRSLLPWRRVLGNVVFGIAHRGLSRAEASARARHNMARVGLADFARHYPWQLSGGQQQRVAIARALAAEPRLLLLDEPFSSVDALTRIELQALLQSIWRETPMTVLLVTHDVDEALTLADRVAVLADRPGRLATVVDVKLSRPRDALATCATPEFLALREQLLGLLLRRADA